MSDSMTKYNHRMTAEESITNFIQYLEESSGVELTEDKVEWLHKKGQDVFEAYYVDNTVHVNLVTQEDKDLLMDYFGEVQTTLGQMFAHIMLVEFKLYLMSYEQ